MIDSPRAVRTLAVAGQVVDALAARGVPAAVIGAMALAAYGYVRDTEDFDLATVADPFTTLREVAADLRRLGLRAELHEPDADDPLGGCLDVIGEDFDLVQVVNFFNPLAVRPNLLGAEAVREAIAGMVSDPRFRIVDLPYLVALKLETGGHRDRSDVFALLSMRRPLDILSLREVCSRHGLGDKLEKVLSELGLA